ncbi:MAG: LD-carboxypeptidase [Candidatus Binatia bacterium]
MIARPVSLQAGDRVALIAPAGRWDEGRLERGVELLESWGLEVVGPGPAEPLRYMAASDRERAAAIARALRDEDIRALLAVRGGFGSARLHADLPLDDLRDRPKIVVGFSDVSVLLSRIVQEAGVVCYHGPMVAADLPRLDDDRRERFRRFLFGEPGWWNGDVTQVWRTGEASAPLVGGCLSVLVTTLGTPYEIRTEGTILFLEDVAEKPYRIDRMLTHMKHAGKLDGIEGLVLGPMLDCDGGEGPAVLRDIVMDAIGDADVPVAYGLDAGHGAGNVVLPLGCRVRLDGGERRVDLVEPALGSTPAVAQDA